MSPRYNNEGTALALFESGKFLHAGQIFKRLAAENAHDSRLRYMAAVAFVKGGDLIQAKCISARLISECSIEDAPEQLMIVHLRSLRLLQNHDEVLSFIKSASLRKRHEFGDEVAREIILALRNVPEAGSRIRALENISSWSGLISLELGRQFYRSGRLNEAERYLSGLDPNLRRSHEFKLLFSSVLTSLGKFNESISFLGSFKSDKDAEILVNLALNKQYLGDLVGAKASLENALSLDPKNKAAGFNLGLIHYATGDYRTGLGYLQMRNGPGFGEGLIGNKNIRSAVLDQGFGEQILFLAILESTKWNCVQEFYGAKERSISFFTRRFPQFKFHRHRVDLGQGNELRDLSEVIFAGLAYGDGSSLQRSTHRANVEEFLLRPSQSVGFSWVSTSPRYGHLKSLTSTDVRNFLIKAKGNGVRLRSLHSYDEIARAPEYKDLDPDLLRFSLEWPLKVSSTEGSLRDLAEVIAGCDAVLTVPNTTAHLAGVMKKRVSVIQRALSGSHWYWTNREIFSCCYPSTTVDSFLGEFSLAAERYFSGDWRKKGPQ